MASVTIDVEGRDGILYGDGPITSAFDLEFTYPLDRAGTFTFLMPSSDSRASLLLTKRRLVRIYLDGSVVFLGIVEEKRDAITADGVTVVQVSGRSLLAELGELTVGSLEINAVTDAPQDILDAIAIKQSLVSDRYAWTLSGSGTNEYYVRLATSADPTLRDPNAVYENAGAMASGTLGSLGAGSWDWGDNDSLGYSTVYVRLADSTDPDTKADGYVEMDFTWLLDGTRIATTEAAGQTLIGVDDNQSLAVGATIHIELDDGTWHETTVSSRLNPNRTQLTIADALPSGAAIDNRIGTVTGGYASTDVTGTTDVYARFAGESGLGALVELAEEFSQHFCYWPQSTDDRSVVWIQDNWEDSGVRAVQGVTNPVDAESNDNICLITNLQVLTDGADIVNTVYPYGAGQGEARLTLAASNRADPANYTSTKASNKLVHDASITAGYPTLEQHVQFKNIGPLSNTDADHQAAANMLFDAAVAWLGNYSQEKTFYSLQVTKLPLTVRPGTTIKLIYIDDQHTIDTDLNVLEIQHRVTSDGARTSRLLVTDASRYPADDAGYTVGAIEQSTIFQAHPQMNANSYITAYDERLWNDGSNTEETAVSRFFFDDSIVQLQSVLFSFEAQGATTSSDMLPISSGVTAVGNISETTSSGGGETPTTSSGGSQTPTSAGGSSHTHTIPNHTHNLTIVYDAAGGNNFYVTSSQNTIKHDGAGGSTSNESIVTDSGSGGTTSAAESSHTHDVTIGSHTHTVTTNDHTHTVTASVSPEYGKFTEANANTFHINDLRYRINGGSWSDLDADATNVSGTNWWELDITSSVYSATTFRPTQKNNTIEFAAKRTNLVSATYRWTASGSGTNEYYCELAAGGDPSLTEPDVTWENNSAMPNGTLGSLNAGQWDWGDNDALGFNTVYVRLTDGADPDSKASEFVEIQGPFSTRKSCRINGQLIVRSIVQAIAYV